MLPAILSTIIFILCLGIILAERMHRTIIAMVGAVLVTAIGVSLEFFSESQAAASVDFNTISLIFGMMILVALLEPTGFFQYLAIWMGRMSRGQPFRMLVLLGSVTTVISMFLPNLTTVVLIAPATILLCELLGIEPKPYLIAEALFANIGGVATLVGDPPNVLIASAAGFTFDDFLVHSLPIILVIWVITMFALRWIFRVELSRSVVDPDSIMKLKPGNVIKDRKTAVKVLVVLGCTIVLFLLEGVLHVRPGFIALAAASTGLAWVQPSLEDTFNRIHWDILIFFTGLFVMVGALEATGVLQALANLVIQANIQNPILLGLILIWVVAFLSAVVDNIPVTIALIPIIQSLAATGYPTELLWWGLVFGAGLGGNGTIIGSTANVVAVAFSEKTRFPITAQQWMKSGLPVTLLSCAAASVLYLLVFGLFG